MALCCRPAPPRCRRVHHLCGPGEVPWVWNNDKKTLWQNEIQIKSSYCQCLIHFLYPSSEQIGTSLGRRPIAFLASPLSIFLVYFSVNSSSALQLFMVSGCVAVFSVIHPVAIRLWLGEHAPCTCPVSTKTYPTPGLRSLSQLSLSEMGGGGGSICDQFGFPHWETSNVPLYHLLSDFVSL